MKTIKLLSGFALLTLAACADENPTLPDGGMPGEYKQIEQLARPGINEAFLLTSAFNAGYNATAPSFAGAPAEAVSAISAEAKTVMKALYLGVCLLDGALRLDANSGLKPAGIACHAVGYEIWTENTPTGVTLTEASKMKAQEYADKVFSQFIPDVMRIDTAGPSKYLTLCKDANTVPLLCGGRQLNDDVIDITYDYLLAGAEVHLSPPPANLFQKRALVSDGVNFSKNQNENSDNVLPSDMNNTNQFHDPISTQFPYSAAPY
jgi:hypothetical protein